MKVQLGPKKESGKNSALSTLWECEGKSGNSTFVPFFKDSRSWFSENPSEYGGSLTSLCERVIKWDQCVVPKLIVVIFFQSFLHWFSTPEKI